MAGECPGRRSPSAGEGLVVGKLSLLVALAEPFSSSASGEAPSRSPTPRSPRNFDYDGGAVGLGIVAALNVGGQDAYPRGGGAVTRTPRSGALSPRSKPIPIVSAAPAAATRWRKEVEDDMELSESYTCVISHVGGGAVRKRVYFDDGAGCSAALFETPPPPPAWAMLLPPAEDFLSRCFWCSKKLHGLDIFMYRGDRAFCSEECRCQQMISDEQREKRVPDALKPFDCCSVSPCSTSTPLFFAAGVAAA